MDVSSPVLVSRKLNTIDSSGRTGALEDDGSTSKRVFSIATVPGSCGHLDRLVDLVVR